MPHPKPQRVIWISTDHMRYDCIGAHGNPAMHTPNLDRLVNEGVSFEQCYVQNPLCMPSRASFMTGLYPQQVGVTQNGNTLRPDFEPTAATTFKAGGYQTVQIGKLHFQQHEDNDLDPRARYDYGFEVFWLSEEPGCYEDAYMTWLRTQRPDLVPIFRVPRSTHPDRKSEENPRVLDAPWQFSHSGWISTMAEIYLNRRRDSKQFLHLGFYAPHPPLNPTREMFEPYDGKAILEPVWAEQEWRDKPEPLARFLHMKPDWTPHTFLEYRRHFYAMVTGVDLALGRLLDLLERNNMLDDTLIAFMSDHGDMCGDHRMVSKQGSYYDQLMRQPCVLYWPGGFGTKGRRVTKLVEMVDLLPTLLRLAGCNVPEVMVGRSYAEALLSGSPVQGRDDVFAYHEPPFGAMLRTATHKYIRYGPGAEVLYDLREQPYEVVNRAKDDPATLQQMRERMLQRFMDASRTPQKALWRF
jgi:arylsulfatase